MIIARIVQLAKALEASRKVGSQPRRVVVAERGVVKAELVVLIVGEARNFLRKKLDQQLLYICMGSSTSSLPLVAE